MIEVVLDDLKQYFNYIKEVYLKSFDKILLDEIKNKIRSINAEDIEYDMESDFDIKVNGTIHYKLNLLSFIENNRLLEEDLSDLSLSEQKRVQYLIDHKENVEQIVKDTLLENMLLLFMPNRDILSCGMSTYLARIFSDKCHLKCLELYKKEAIIIENLCELFDEKTVFLAILNGDYEKLQKKYDHYVTDNHTWKNIYSSLQQEFDHYYKNKSKIYYIDSLYNYSNLDYEKVIKRIKEIKNCKEKVQNDFLLRVNSIMDCIQELNRYMILLKEPDKNNLYYAGLNLKRILEKNNNLIQYKDEILKVEQELKPIVDYVWNYYINFEGKYDPDSNYWFLIQNYKQVTDEHYQVMNLITSEHVKVSNYKNRYKYGFIYRIQSGAIIYSSPDRIIYKEMDNVLEIEEQIYSNLLTPRNLLLKTLEKNEQYNSVLVDKNYVTKRAIYCICKSDQDPDYEKALELANKYELPLIQLNESSNLSR